MQIDQAARGFVPPGRPARHAHERRRRNAAADRASSTSANWRALSAHSASASPAASLARSPRCSAAIAATTGAGRDRSRHHPKTRVGRSGHAHISSASRPSTTAWLSMRSPRPTIADAGRPGSCRLFIRSKTRGSRFCVGGRGAWLTSLAAAAGWAAVDFHPAVASADKIKRCQICGPRRSARLRAGERTRRRSLRCAMKRLSGARSSLPLPPGLATTPP